MGYIGSKHKTLGSVNTSHIADDAVTSAKIKDDITFTNVTASNNVSASGTVQATSFQGVFEGALSSSAQIKTNISGSFTDASSSFSTRVSNLKTDSGSYSTRVSNLKSDSGSFSTRVSNLKTDSGSFSTRVSNLKTDSGSFSTRIDNSEASGALMNQDLKTSASPTFVNVTATGTMTAQEFHTEFVSASIVYRSGSTKFGDSIDDIHSFTGSINQSGSFNLNDGNMSVTDTLTATTLTGTTIKDFSTISGSSSSTGSFGVATIGASIKEGVLSVTSNAGSNPTNLPAINLNQDNSLAKGLFIATDTTTQSAIQAEADSLTTGRIARLYSNSSTTGTRNLVEIINDNTSATGAKCLELDQDANQEAFKISHDGTTNRAMQIDASALTTGDGLMVYSNASNTDSRKLLHIINDHASATGATGLHIRQDSTGPAIVTEGTGYAISGSATSTGSFGAAHIMGVGASSIALGVGTSAPASTLHMKAGAPELRIESTGTDDASRLRLINDAGGDWYVGAGAMDGSSNFQAVISNASTGINIKTDGNVGIGTNNPATTLHVSKSSGGVRFTFGNDSEMTWGRDTSGVHQYVGSNQFIRWLGDAGSDEWMRIIDGGNVGIGTTSPAEQLQVYKAGSTSDNVHMAITSGTAGIAGIKLGDSDDRDWAQLRYNNSTGVFQLLRAEKGITISSGGHASFDGNVSGSSSSTGSFARIELDPARAWIKRNSAKMRFEVGSNYNGFEFGEPDIAEPWVSIKSGAHLSGSSTSTGSFGAVGIGTANPTSQKTSPVKLDVNGAILFGRQKSDSVGSGYSAMWGGEPAGDSARWGLRVATAAADEDLYLDANLAGTPHTVMTWDKVNGYVGIGTTSPGYLLHLEESDNVHTTRFKNSNGSFGAAISQWVATRAANSAYDFVKTYSNDTSDVEHNLRGDGALLSDTAASTPADYAEYFEVALTEHTGSGIPVGTVVSLTGSKVIPTSQSNVEPIGVVRPAGASTVGNTAWNRWQHKYIRTPYGNYDLDENGDRKLNPAYSSSLSYQPREDRDEWVIVGLLGQMAMNKGQPTASSWSKMNDITDTVEMWFVK